jgi:hypothetical protein
MFDLDAEASGCSARHELIYASGCGVYLEVAAAVTTFLLSDGFFDARSRRSDAGACCIRCYGRVHVNAAGGTRRIPVVKQVHYRRAAPVNDNVLPSGSANHATKSPLGDVQTPSARWSMPS